jgi:hypothetical protein
LIEFIVLVDEGLFAALLILWFVIMNVILVLFEKVFPELTTPILDRLEELREGFVGIIEWTFQAIQTL